MEMHRLSVALELDVAVLARLSRRYSFSYIDDTGKSARGTLASFMDLSCITVFGMRGMVMFSRCVVCVRGGGLMTCQPSPYMSS